ncbi:cardiolipin synthase [Maribellus sp. YY47]|uniref:cardiolipin synthase n=1 Tax=Maribellus sp. YY47 TaxID=2929486 RepID=UPI0020010312|nr:cardiolipin synthase [Maribellus sp. YY47]MCK3685850.1 cardiolipin synthase [Maribellus sp. YY47]
MFDWSQYFGWFYFAFMITAIPVAIMIILEKRSPYKTAAWILALILLPIFGVLFYLVFGQEYRKRKMFSVRGLKGLKEVRKISAQQLRQFKQIEQPKEVSEFQNIIRLMLNSSNALLTTGNTTQILVNGENTFKALFEAIGKAKHHIHLEYYILADDVIGTRLKELLLKKRAEGVEVRVIVDDVGSWELKKKFYRELRENSIEIYPFMEVRFPRLTSKVNYRNHRKIVVIDGKTGFIGGVNIADHYLNGIPKAGPWYDMHLKIEGDAVATLQIIFAADWFFVSQKNIVGRKYFPVFSEAPGIPIQICAGGPDYDWEGIAQAFFAAIVNARKRVYLVTPYLMPPAEMLMALKTAALSQVDVRIIIPEKSDARLSKWCTFSYVEELLEAGVRIFLFKAGFIHSKYMLVDDSFSTIGTSNFDFRSFETNFEANAFLYSREFSAELETHFLNDLEKSEEVSLLQWQERPVLDKFRESLAHVAAPMF